MFDVALSLSRNRTGTIYALSRRGLTPRSHLQNAAPSARRVLDYWIKGLYPTDKDIAGVQAGTATAPLTGSER